MKTSKIIPKVHKLLDNFLALFLSLLIVLLVLDVLWQVFSRYVLNSPSSFTDELARYLMIWVALLSASYVTGKKAHVAIGIISDKVKRKWLDKLVLILVGTFVVLVLIIGGIQYALISFELNQRSSTMQVPLGYVYLALPISGLFSTGYILLHLFEVGEKNK